MLMSPRCGSTRDRRLSPARRCRAPRNTYTAGARTAGAAGSPAPSAGSYTRPSAIGPVITRHTTKRLGIRIARHDARDAAATTWAIAAPEQMGVARDLLAQSDLRMTTKYYNRAKGIEASRAHGRLIARLRRRPVSADSKNDPPTLNQRVQGSSPCAPTKKTTRIQGLAVNIRSVWPISSFPCSPDGRKRRPLGRPPGPENRPARLLAPWPSAGEAGRPPEPATNKCLAQRNKSRTGCPLNRPNEPTPQQV